MNTIMFVVVIKFYSSTTSFHLMAVDEQQCISEVKKRITAESGVWRSVYCIPFVNEK